MAVRAGVARSNPFALADDSGIGVGRRQLIQHPEYCFIKPDVDDLAGAAGAYVQQGDQRADGTVEAGQIIAQRG